MGNVILAALGAFLGVAGFLQAFPPIGRSLQYWSNSLMPNRIPEPEDLLVLAATRRIDSATYYNLMKQHGFNELNAFALWGAWLSFPSTSEVLEAWLRKIIPYNEVDDWLVRSGVGFERLPIVKALAYRILTFEQALTAYWRGLISKETFLTIAEANGYKEEDALLLEQIHKYYPSPSDVVRFAVREVYNPEIRKLYGLDEDLSPEYLEMARKVGLSEEFARDYWAAHWELPSLSMGFEMFHRGIITYDELITLMRTLDIMPYWRDKLVQLSYELVTRVDARRLLELGIWTPERFYEHMKALGYSPSDAYDITNWAIKEYIIEKAELTKSDIKSALEAGEITVEEAFQMLKNIGYDEFEAQLILNDFLRSILKNWVNKNIEYWKHQFVTGKIDLDTLRAELNKLPISSTRVETEILDALLKQEGKRRLPSKEDVIHWYRNGQITIETAKRYLKLLGYSDFEIHLYLGGKEEEYVGR